MSNKRWKSETEIIKAIDQCYEFSNKALAEAELAQQTADRNIKEAYNFEATDVGRAAGLRNSAGFELAKAKKLRRKAANYIEKKARRLGVKLSEFRTALITAVAPDGDRSIPR